MNQVLIFLCCVIFAFIAYKTFPKIKSYAIDEEEKINIDSETLYKKIKQENYNHFEKLSSIKFNEEERMLRQLTETQSEASMFASIGQHRIVEQLIVHKEMETRILFAKIIENILETNKKTFEIQERMQKRLVFLITEQQKHD